VSRRLRVILVVLCVIALVALAGALIWRLGLRDRAVPASVAAALARYREVAAAAEAPVPPGVYVYETSGSESVSALGGTTHDYPPTSTITVTASSCGMALRWDVLQTRTTTAEVCVDDDPPVVQRLAGWTEVHQFFGRDDETTWTCASSPWLVAGDTAATTFEHSCDGGDTEQTGTVEVVGEETVDVGGVDVQATHVRLEAEEQGAARGEVVEERWLEPETGLPLRLSYRVRTDNASLIGNVVFEERYELTLTSLEPRT
jgi:hypothetical protein